MILKKIIIKLAILLIAISSQYIFANNLYIGGGIGISNLADRQTVTAPISAEAPSTHDYSGFGMLSSIFGGYKFDIYKSFSLGIEGFFTGSNNQIGIDDISINPINNEQPATTMRISQRYLYGIRLLPGYKITQNITGYVILGVSRSVFRLIDNGAYALGKSSFGAYGPQFGLGGSANIIKNLDIRLDVMYNRYPSHYYTISGPLPVCTTISPSCAGYYHDSLSSFDSMISISYRF
jgi:hypothetical protein